MLILVELIQTVIMERFYLKFQGSWLFVRAKSFLFWILLADVGRLLTDMVDLLVEPYGILTLEPSLPMSKVLYWGNWIYWNFNAICFSPERKASLFWILLTEEGWLLADVVVLQAEP